MVVRLVQQFCLVEDDFYNEDDEKAVDLTISELAQLDDNEGEPILLERLGGFFLLADDQEGSPSRECSET